MEKSRDERSDAMAANLGEEFSFEESVCSAEFSQGCTLPLSQQLDQP